MKKLANHIILSGVTVSMLFSPLMALPSGGKFTHGTSGTITTNGNNMNINGKGPNSVIQWGGGFNIANGEKVNFGGKDKNYLNIAHGTSKSTIAGILNAGGNNVFLINPNGVIITKTGTINANRFVASTSSMSDGDMKAFANLKSFEDGLSFSPVFKPNKAGNVVNMGNINTNNVLLIGNKVDIQSGKVGNKNSTTHLVGNDLVLNPGSFTENKTNNITALRSVEIGSSMSAFKDSGYKFVGADGFTLTNYTDNNNKATENKVQKIDFKQYLTIDSVGEWAIFADAWNGNKDGKGLGDTRKVKEFRLIDDIDFNNDFKPEYMVGHIYNTIDDKNIDWTNAFTSTFNGNGYTLSNITMDIINANVYNKYYAGIFSGLQNATIKNLKLKNIDIRSHKSAGSLGAFSMNSNFYDISMNGVKVYTHLGHAGGMLARTYGDDAGKFERIKIENINIDANQNGAGAYTVTNAGGFIAVISAGHFNDIFLNNIEKIESGGIAGGFGATLFNENYTTKDGKFKFENIKLTNVGKKNADSTYSDGIQGGSWAGGFFGQLGAGDSSVEVKNIYMDNIYRVSSYQNVGGFAETFGKGSIENVYMGNIGIIESTGSSGVEAGGFLGDTQKEVTIKNITIDNIDKIIFGRGGSQGFSGGFIGKMYESGTLENIVINRIGEIEANGNQFGLFAGDLDPNITIKNVIMNNIGNITCKSWRGCDYVDNSGFVYRFGDNSTFENIHIFFSGNDYSGINDLVYSMWASKNATFKDFYMYYNEKYFTNSDLDIKQEWNKDKYAHAGINFKKINNTETEKQDFVISAQTATGIQYDQASNSFKTTTDFEVTDPKFSTIGEGEDNPDDAKLDEDDLLKEMIKEEIINDITNRKYELHISDLLKMLEDKANYSNMSENQKIEFIAKYFLGGDKTQALEVIQSLNFILAYEKNGLSTASKNKFKGNGFSVKNEILSQVNNTTKTIKDKINKLEEDLESLASSSEQSLEDLIAEQNNLNGVVDAYNAYVDLINKGLASKNDPEFITLKNQIDVLMKDSQILADLINENQKELSIWQNNNNTENFKVVGAFANVILNTNPNLKEITGEGGDGEEPNKPELPDNDLEFEQTASFNLIGDETVEEEKEVEEVEETAMMQKNRTCIVSDNFKTMNPCAVGGL
ncbi:filamentous hemagglutinin N-terminal domain-containing protein [Campylobacter lari]|nr:filamentous hemagglutinin N-terminal domain-containing protein [Campylobacter lari]EAL7139771.1 filamentous hemagglutinin N-terminal domain-containing protein [Campylobacter lari]